MLRKGMTVQEAAREWVRQFNAIPQGMIEKLMNAEPDSWTELTLPTVGDTVYVFDVPESGMDHYGEISGYGEEDEMYTIKFSDGKQVLMDPYDFDVQRDGFLPMWGMMWSFDDNCDNWWLEEGDGIRVMSECGFRIYESEEFGYFFGIDGAGYSFYDEHWVPLYRARGLQWHDPATEDTPEKLVEKVKAIVGEGGGADELVTKLTSLKPHEEARIGGYYGGFIPDATAKKLEGTGHFNARLFKEMVQEMSHLEENRYWLITSVNANLKL